MKEDDHPHIEAERPRLGLNLVLPVVFYACAILAAAGLYEAHRIGAKRLLEEKGALEAEVMGHREVLGLNRQLETKRDLLRASIEMISCVKGDEGLSPQLRQIDEEELRRAREEEVERVEEYLREIGQVEPGSEGGER